MGTSGLEEHTVSKDPADGCNSHNYVATHCTVQCVCVCVCVLIGMPLTRCMLHRKVARLWVGKIWKEDLAGFIRRDWAKREKTHNRGYSVSSLIFKWSISLKKNEAWDWANLLGIQSAITQNNTIICVCVCVPTHIPVTAMKLFYN